MMYQAKQETLRKEIEHRSVDTLAAALARCIDDAHAKAQNLPAVRELEETAQVRAGARQLLSDIRNMPLRVMAMDTGLAAASDERDAKHDPPSQTE
jgi:hypothetical protein